MPNTYIHIYYILKSKAQRNQDESDVFIENGRQ